MTAIAPKTETAEGSMHPVATAVAARLRASSYASLRGVFCQCRGGVLILRGRLPSFYLKQVAQAAAGGLEGVSRIDNHIEVADGAALHEQQRSVLRPSSFLNKASCQVVTGEPTCMP
jgi:osmotically-inducible protein OsmY